jgi:Fic family protein
LRKKEKEFIEIIKWRLFMSKKKYPTTNKEWVKYLTIENYYTLNEIEYRKLLIIETGCNFDGIMNIIKEYREKQKNIIFEFEEKKFYFVETYELKQRIDKIKSFWKNTEYLVKEKFSFELLKETLTFEGYYSSTIEGAHSTVKRAKILAKGYEKPKNKDEIMVLNNFKALIELREKNELINHNLIKNLHKIITDKTLEDENDSGIYRKEANMIVDDKQKIIFSPPANIDNMNKMLDKLLKFLEVDEFKKPIDDIYKSIAFHFLFAYIHPFMDGNGRTVRILFTYLLKYYGYDMFYYISLSEIIYRKKAKGYYKSFLDVERSNFDDKNSYDMTYFFYYMTDIMLQGLEILKNRINTHLREDIINHRAKELGIDLTPRQKKMIKILSNKNNSFMLTIEELSKRLKVSISTTRKDLKLLREFELLKRVKVPKQRKYYFKLNIDL